MRSSITPPDVSDFMKARADALAREVAILAQTGAEPAPISEAECATIREQATARRGERPASSENDPPPVQLKLATI